MSWISPEAVSGTILDVALGADTPERALNVVHPRRIAWSSMLGAVADVLVRHGITEDRLPLVETREWFAKLAEAADGADEAQLKNIVRECAVFFARLRLTPTSSLRSSYSTSSARRQAQTSPRARPAQPAARPAGLPHWRRRRRSARAARCVGSSRLVARTSGGGSGIGRLRGCLAPRNDGTEMYVVHCLESHLGRWNWDTGMGDVIWHVQYEVMRDLI
jgi:hypothetical protein